MRPGHVPYGYRIKDGAAVIHEDEAKNVEKIYELYLSGMGLQGIADTLGLDLFHGGVSRIITNKKYLGTGFYPKILDEEVFNKASEEKQRRAVKLKRTDRIKVATKEPACYNFVMGKAKEKYDDPFAQASYLYGLIRNEVVCNGSK
jgi:hypothetical protein